MPKGPEKPTLYDRLGGIYSIAVVVDDFVDRIMVDDRLNGNPHLNITPKEWDAFMDDFRQTLDKFKVPAAEQAELKAIVNGTY